MFILLMFWSFLTLSESACTYPSDLRGEWYSTRDGEITFTDSTLVGKISNAVTATQTYNCEFNGTENRYISKANVSFFSTVTGYLYTCMNFERLSSSVYTFTYDTDISSTVSERIVALLSSSTVVPTEANICTLDKDPYTIGSEEFLVKKGSSLSVTCPSILHSTFSVFVSGTSCSGTVLDGRTDNSRLAYTYSTCATDILFSVHGLYECVYSFTSGDHTYLTVLNADNATTDESSKYRFSCLVIERKLQVVFVSEYPQVCQADQTPRQVSSPGKLLLLIDTDPDFKAGGLVAVGVFIGLTYVIVLAFTVVTFISWLKAVKQKQITSRGKFIASQKENKLFHAEEGNSKVRNNLTPIQEMQEVEVEEGRKSEMFTRESTANDGFETESSMTIRFHDRSSVRTARSTRTLGSARTTIASTPSQIRNEEIKELIRRKSLSVPAYYIDRRNIAGNEVAIEQSAGPLPHDQHSIEDEKAFQEDAQNRSRGLSKTLSFRIAEQKQKMVQFDDGPDAAVELFYQPPQKWQVEWESFADPLSRGSSTDGSGTVRSLPSIGSIPDISWSDPLKEEKQIIRTLWKKVNQLFPGISKKHFRELYYENGLTNIRRSFDRPPSAVERSIKTKNPHRRKSTVTLNQLAANQKDNKQKDLHHQKDAKQSEAHKKDSKQKDIHKKENKQKAMESKETESSQEESQEKDSSQNEANKMETNQAESDEKAPVQDGNDNKQEDQTEANEMDTEQKQDKDKEMVAEESKDVSAGAEDKDTNQTEDNVEDTKDENNTEDTVAKDDNTNQAETNDGNTDQAETNDGNTDQAETNDGNTDQTETNEGNTDQAETNEANVNQGDVNEKDTNREKADTDTKDEKVNKHVPERKEKTRKKSAKVK